MHGVFGTNTHTHTNDGYCYFRISVIQPRLSPVQESSLGSFLNLAFTEGIVIHAFCVLGLPS